METSTVTLLTLVLLAIAGGCLLGTAFARAQSRLRERAWQSEIDASRAGAEAQVHQHRAATAHLEGAMQNQERELRDAKDALERARVERDRERQEADQLEKTLIPLRAAFEGLQKGVNQSEQARITANAQLKQQVEAMAKDFASSAGEVKTEARKLSQVLSRSEKRGAWGEMQLKQLVESAGMVNHVHFVEQDHTNNDGAIQRPDMIIKLAGGRTVVVDAKVPLDAFLRDDVDDSATLAAHSEAVANHIKKLSAKAYWKQYDSPEFVMLFLPSENLLGAALQHRPDLMQLALDKRIILATPNVMIAALFTVHHAWRQAETADQAAEIQRVGSEFYDRILVMAAMFEKLGKSIGGTVDAYNSTVGTLEARVLVSGRNLEKLLVVDRPLPEIAPVEGAIRALNDDKWPTRADGLAIAEGGLIDPQQAPNQGPSRRTA